VQRSSGGPDVVNGVALSSSPARRVGAHARARAHAAAAAPPNRATTIIDRVTCQAARDDDRENTGAAGAGAGAGAGMGFEYPANLIEIVSAGVIRPLVVLLRSPSNAVQGHDAVILSMLSKLVENVA
jgi:hypothetical protein